MMCMTLTLVGCQFSEHGELYDNQDRWTQSGDTYSFLGMVESEHTIRFNRFSGLFTLKRWQEEGEWTITLDHTINQGLFQCFLVTGDDEVILLEEGLNVISAHVGYYRLRIVGKDAKGNLTYTID